MGIELKGMIEVSARQEASQTPDSAPDSPGAKRPRRLGKKLVLLFCGCLVGLVCAEIVVRLILLQEKAFRAPRTIEDAPFIQVSNNAILNYEHVPNSEFSDVYQRFLITEHPVEGLQFEEVEIEVPFRINRHGFRGEDWAETPNSNTVRIAVIGDSETFARRLRPDETPTARLAFHLQEQFPEESFEVLNFGVGGYATEQEFELLRTRVLSFRPDIVLLYYVTNDPQIDLKAAIVYSTTSNPLSHSAAFRLARFQLAWGGTTYQKIGPCNTYHEYLDLLYDSPYWDATRVLLKQMAQTVRHSGAEFAIIILPELIDTDSFDTRKSPYTPTHSRIESLRNEGIAVINPLPALEATKVPPPLLRVTVDDGHIGSFATDKMAEYIASSDSIRDLVEQTVQRKSADRSE